MTEGRVQRRLAAILAADVAGYSRLMGADEVGTLAALKDLRREIVDPAIAEHHGRIVKTTGDGMLVEFASAVDAVSCAVGVQTKVAERNRNVSPQITLRIGINVGDIIIDEDDIFGDGVNVAARVENECEPGRVCLSGSAFEQVRGKTNFTFDDLGERLLKNIERPVQLYGWRTGGPTQSNDLSSSVELREMLPLPDKPSVAVLPFQNMSGDPEQEYFADGIVEDIITALSRFKSLFVIARNSSFAYRGKATDIKRVGRDLGVRYVLEGSVRKAGGKVRITGQLIDSLTGTHLWADRFEGQLTDIFELQDQVTASVVGELVTEVQFAEEERAKRKATVSLDAYDCYLRGRANAGMWTKASTEVAQAYFAKAIELDETFALAYAWAGQMLVLRKQNRWMTDAAHESAEAIRLARRAIELGQVDDLALCMGGFILAYVGGELDLAEACIRRGLAINTNLSVGWNLSGWVQMYLGNHQVALQHQYRSERLSPRAPNVWQVKMGCAYAHFFEESYEEAARLARQITGPFPTLMAAWRILAASKALGGDLTLATKASQTALELDPSQRVSALASQMPLRRIEDRERWQAGLLLAGFPR